jgi:hypothetical protein
MPGLAIMHPKPSAAPVPVHVALVHDESFCPATITQCPLLHCESFVHEQARPDPLHAPPAALQPPTRQPYVAADTGQPAAPQVPASPASEASGPASLASGPVSAGASTGASAVAPSLASPASPASVSADTHPPETHVSPAAHAWPHEPQLAALVSVSTHAPLQRFGALDGHEETQEYAPSTSAHAVGQVFPHAPQLDGLAGSAQPPSHASRPPSHAPASAVTPTSLETSALTSPAESGPGGVTLSASVVSSGASRPASLGGGTVRSRPASHPLVQSPEV